MRILVRPTPFTLEFSFDDSDATRTPASHIRLQPMPDTPQEVNPGQDDPVSDDSVTNSISPSVRRLLRQYDVDINDVRGTGPNGRVRPGDVLAIVGNPQLTRHTDTVDEASEEGSANAATSQPEDVHEEPEARDEALGTTVFVVDMTRVLAHRKRLGHNEISIVCYAAKAAGLAATKLEQLRNPRGHVPLRVRLTTSDGEAVAMLGTPATESPEAIHAAISQAPGADESASRARLSLSHHGLPGNLLDVQPPLGRHEAATLSLGGLQRTIGIGGTDKGDAPRLVVQSHLAMTYRPSIVSAAAAARFVAECVRLLENWPLPD